MSSRRIEFVYFDLGNVLLAFDHSRASRNIAELCGVEPAQVHHSLFHSDIQHRYESGSLDSKQFHDHCRQSFGECSYDDVLDAAADIFSPIDAVHRLVEQLAGPARSLGVLSNTCEAHWLWSVRQYQVLERFEHCVLSYEVKGMKPDPPIYAAAEAAAKRACGAAPESIFFVDDRAENVEAARKRGWDAVQFHDPERLQFDLAQRDLLS